MSDSIIQEDGKSITKSETKSPSLVQSRMAPINHNLDNSLLKNGMPMIRLKIKLMMRKRKKRVEVQLGVTT